jgi:XTP/dITP diphosphohydrolase
MKIAKKNICVATSNDAKYNEFSDAFRAFDITIYDLKSFDLSAQTPEEYGETFEENAIIKGLYYSELIDMAVLSDDSGFCITAIDGEPGIYSARWISHEQDTPAVIKKIKSRLEENGIKNFENLDAYFYCALALCYKGEKLCVTSGKISGKMTFDARGKNKFAYDPIFIPNAHKRTFAEMLPEEKCAISHRAIAINNMIKQIFNYE